MDNFSLFLVPLCLIGMKNPNVPAHQKDGHLVGLSLHAEESSLHLLFLWSWFCSIGSVSPISPLLNCIWDAISINCCKSSPLILEVLMGIMSHSIWKSRNNFLFHRKAASSSSICNAFLDEADFSLKRIKKPFTLLV